MFNEACDSFLERTNVRRIVGVAAHEGVIADCWRSPAKSNSSSSLLIVRSLGVCRFDGGRAELELHVAASRHRLLRVFPRIYADAVHDYAVADRFFTLRWFGHLRASSFRRCPREGPHVEAPCDDAQGQPHGQPRHHL
jgi:hypothetical protein